MSQRLVEQIQRCRLCQQRGNGQPLPLSARECLHIAVFEVGKADRLQCAAGDFGILFALPVPATEMRVATGECGFQYGAGKGIVVPLRQPATVLRSLAWAKVCVRGTAQRDLAGIGITQPGEHRKQGRFAGAIPAKDGQPLAGLQSKVEIGADLMFADADIKAMRFDQRGTIHRGCLANRNRNTGTPISAVSTPTGSCCGATMVRASVSASVNIVPPARTDAGSSRR